MARRQQEVYRRVFIAWHGDLPHPCFFCGDVVTTWGRRSAEGTIHHVDEDFTNNDPTNLAAAHMGCHVRHHSSEQEPYERTPEIRAKTSASLRGKTQGAESNAKRAASLREAYAEGRRKPGPGRPRGIATRTEACIYCGRDISVNNLLRHVAVHTNGRTPRVR